jgi:RNA polymerase sigma-70 factor (sigma-E family)
MAARDDPFTEFVQVASAGLHRSAYLVCGDWHRANDAVQEGLYRLYLAWPRVDRARSIHAYARRVVINAALDNKRRPWRRREQSWATPPDRAVPDISTPHAERAEMLALLDRLPPRQRACLVLRYYDALTVEETAEVLGCTPGTVKSQSSKALNHLREHLARGTTSRSST